MQRFTSVFLLVTIMITAFGSTGPVEAAPQRAVIAKYYAWFDDNTWVPQKVADYPIVRYRSADRSTIERHVTQAQSAGIDAFALSWIGTGNPTDWNLQTLLSVSQQKGFKATVDFETNSPLLHNPGDVVNALRYVTDRYLEHPAWFRYQGRPVIVFWHTRLYDVGTWRWIRDQVDPHRQAIWMAEGDIFSYLEVFDGIHPYSIAWSANPERQLASYAQRTRAYPGKLWMPTVMPGYDDLRTGRPDAFVRQREGGTYYLRTWEGAIATQPDLISITSFNEWIENTMIEPSISYGDKYLNLTRQMVDKYRGGGFASTVAIPPARGQADFAIAGGRFYTQANGHAPGTSGSGYAIVDNDGLALWASFRALGGVAALGFPSSHRYRGADGFVYQAAQGGLLQWRPELGRATLANTFEMLQAAGKDDWLDQAKSIPRPISDDGSGGNWNRAKAERLSWLTDPAIRQRYLSNPNPTVFHSWSVDQAIELYGLPMSRPERRGPFVVQRFQRIAFQHWVEAVPGMPAPGTVVRVLGGDLLKEAGLIPMDAATPASPPL